MRKKLLFSWFFIISTSNSFQVYGQQLKNFRSEANDYLRKNMIYRGCTNNCGEVIIETNNGGCIILSKNDKVVRNAINLTQTWHFLKFKVPDTEREILPVASNQGIYKIEDDKLILVTPENVSFVQDSEENI